MKNVIYSFVKENNWLIRNEYMNFGWGNGYVVLPKDHPMNGKHYDEIPVDVHGGLTFAHGADSLSVDDFPELNPEMCGGWVVGFDTAHYNDTLERWPKERVLAETKELRLQLGRMLLPQFNFR